MFSGTNSVSHKRFKQYKFIEGNIGTGHGEMVCARGSVTPYMVVDIEFVDKKVENTKMTAIQVNGDMRTPVRYDLSDERFKVAMNLIVYE